MDAGITDDEEFTELVDKLGNKLLLEESINRSIGNAWFRTKVQTSVKDKSGYKNSKYVVATSLVEKYSNKEKPYWKKDDIINTTNKIARRISKFIFR
jgi:hypothetical protein